MQRVESIILVIKYIYCVMATSVHNIVNSVKLKILSNLFDFQVQCMYAV